MPFQKTVFLSISFATLLLYGCVTEQDFYLLRDRIDVLEQRMAKQDEQVQAERRRIDEMAGRMEGINQTGVRKEQDFRTRSAEISAGMDQLKETIRELRGRIEETEHRVKQQQQISGDLEGRKLSQLDKIDETGRQTRDRVARIEQYLNLEPAPKPDKEKPKSPEAAKPEPVKPAEAEKPLTEADLYKDGRRAFDEGNFTEARERFETFLKMYPKSGNADNAQFWIGETYYREKWFEKAILEYQKVIENYPKGNKIQSALLKQGLAFFSLGDTANSRLILNEVVNKFPNTSEAKIAQQKLKEIR